MWILGIGLLFVGIRLYRIETSLFLRNDIGRDLFTLQAWHSTHKPPLLGPQTNLLPFNQSAWYFYILYPVYLLSGESPFATIYAGLVVYVSILVLSFVLIRKQKEILLPLSLFWLVVTIHPIVIQQNRYIWNPSFVLPFITLAVISFWNLQKSFSVFHKSIFGLSLGFAVGVSLSAIPSLIAFLFTSVFVFRKKAISLIPYLIGGLAFVFLPTLIHEIRHEFQLTQAILSSHFQTQTHFLPIENAQTILRMMLAGLNLAKGTILIIVAISVLLSIKPFSTKLTKELGQQKLFQLVLLFLSTFLVLSCVPFALEQYYVWGAVTFFIFIICFTKVKLAVISILLLSLFWLSPTTVQPYFTKAPNTVGQLESCIKTICQQYPEPLFVSVQASFHKYHRDQSFEFFMNQQGCQLAQISMDATAADKMVVFADQDTYVHHQTQYHELTLFGDSSLVEKFECQGNVQAYILGK